MSMHSFFHDLRYAPRQLRCSTRSAPVALLTLGIGATTAMLDVVLPVVMRQVALHDAQALAGRCAPASGSGERRLLARKPGVPGNIQAWRLAQVDLVEALRTE